MHLHFVERKPGHIAYKEIIMQCTMVITPKLIRIDLTKLRDTV